MTDLRRQPPAQTIREPQIQIAHLRRLGGAELVLTPDDPARQALAERLRLAGLDQLRLQGRLSPADRDGWDFIGRLTARVVQPCVATLAPVTTRIDEPVERRWRSDLAAAPEGSETEMPEDDTLEPLGPTLDLGAVLGEALALALPLYPRADGADVTAMAAPPGVEPLRDADLHPFAGLKALKDLGEDG